jgi:hypothetical protein
MTMPAMINGAGKQALNNSGPPVTIYFAELRLWGRGKSPRPPNDGFGQGQEWRFDLASRRKNQRSG